MNETEQTQEFLNVTKKNQVALRPDFHWQRCVFLTFRAGYIEDMSLTGKNIYIYLAL